MNLRNIHAYTKLELKNWKAPAIIMIMPIIWMLTFLRSAWDCIYMEEYWYAYRLPTNPLPVALKCTAIMLLGTIISLGISFYWHKENLGNKKLWKYARVAGIIFAVGSVLVGFIVYFIDANPI